MTSSKAVHIGTSGWNYKHWKGPFYPEDLSNKKLLPYYAERFSTVEVNNSFYKLPSRDTFSDWRKAVGKAFTFAVKGSRFITHMKKLKDPEEPIERLMDRVEGLGSTLGPILFQLPPNWRCNPERLAHFLDKLPRKHRYAMEFRDESWWNEDVYALLKDHNVAFCAFHLAGQKSPHKLTADFAYVRLHGPEGKYGGRYDTRGLQEWKKAFPAWLGHVKEIYCYFDNDDSGYAPQDALKLNEMMGIDTGEPH